ncbi:guanylate kinase [bacterium]|nr:guanylate kinase [bacterium]
MSGCQPDSDWPASLEERCLVISGPSGVGKTTIVQAALKQNPGWIQCITCTTRPPREHEVNGRDYYFLSEEQFMGRVCSGQFLEYAEVYGRHYGTPLSEIERASAENKRLIIVVDTVGCLSIRALNPEVKLLGLLPPSMEVLRQRLASRGDESPAEISQRLAEAYIELTRMNSFDFSIVNDDLDKAVSDLLQLLNLLERGTHVTDSRIRRLHLEMRSTQGD